MASIYLDQIDGDDKNGERDNPARPYATLQGAIDACNDGDEIVSSQSTFHTSHALVIPARLARSRLTLRVAIVFPQLT